MTPAEALAVRRTADGDARWFRTHRDRNYRVRHASPIEITMQCRAMEMEAVPQGFRVYAAIYRFKKHERCTALLLSKADNDVDNASEEKAAALFLLAASRRPSATMN